MLGIFTIFMFLLVLAFCDHNTTDLPSLPVPKSVINQTQFIVAQSFESKRNLDASQPSSSMNTANSLPVNLNLNSNQKTTQDSVAPVVTTALPLPTKILPIVIPNITRIPQVGSHASSNNDDYCPAVKAPGSNTYIGYNPTYTAATLDELVTYFVDPITDDPSIAKTLTGNVPDTHDPYKKGKNDPICTTKECMGCVEILADRLKSQQFGESSSFDSIHRNSTAANVALGMVGFLGLGHGKMPLAKFCPRLYHPRDKSKSRKVMTKPVDVTSDQLKQINEFIKPSTRTGRRDKRDNSKPGIVTKLDCSYRRGDQTNDSSNMAGLCNLCWSFRTLPTKYFPRYINELSCDSNDNSCLSNYGTCVERYRSVDVLYNLNTDESPKWIQYSINTPVACECRVQTGSVLYNLVSH